MSRPGGGIGDAAAPRSFRRSLAARLTTLTALMLFGTAVALRAADGAYGVGFLAATAMGIAGLVGSISAWGDRFRLDDDGVTWENALLVALAGGRGGLGRRRLAWSDVAHVRAHGTALFLVPYRGRRMVLDAIEDFDDVRRRVERAVGAEASSGVSTRPADRPR